MIKGLNTKDLNGELEIIFIRRRLPFSNQNEGTKTSNI
jgi:hypothetical protein